MKTVEERAQEYANAGATLFMDSPEEDMIYRDDLASAHAAGAKAERAELTRWRDPKKELPDNNHRALIKVTDGQQERIYLGSREGDVWMADGGCVFHSHVDSVIGFDGVVISWREINE